MCIMVYNSALILLFSIVWIFQVIDSAQEWPFIWPLPYQYTVSDTFTINVNSTNFEFIQNNTSSDIITNAFKRYNLLCFPHIAGGIPDSSMNIINKLVLNINDSSENTLQYGMDESYSLIINSDTATATATAILNSNTIWGALRGLETFSQLIILNSTIRYYQTYSVLINDLPRFSHRGLMIDTSRHFIPISTLKSILDAASYNKMNVFHWHITDDTSFPLESLSYPKLWDGSLSPNMPSQKYYLDDISDIINYARDRGIRIIPEFDIPAHAQSWCVGYPLICPPNCTNELNPASNETWVLLNGFLNEMSSRFIDNFMHIGGDEVYYDCWNTTQSIVNWMNQMNFTCADTEEWFDLRAINITYNNNKTAIQWDDPFTRFIMSKPNNPFSPNRVIYQAWRWQNNDGSAKSTLPSIVYAGYRGIFSHAPYYYFNLNVTWQQRYTAEPLYNISNINQQKLVLGGEACMWTDHFDNSIIQQTIWPAASAISERLWSQRNITDTKLAQPRLEYMKCLMNWRGIPAGPVTNPFGTYKPRKAGTCYDQR